MSGALAMIIPPSALAVILGSLMEISIGKLLIAGILPGLLMAAMYVTYIAIRCTLQPSLAPDYVPEMVPWSKRIKAFSKHVLPFGVIIFVVTGLIFAGMATPTESAAMGVLATAAVVAACKKLPGGGKEIVDLTLNYGDVQDPHGVNRIQRLGSTEQGKAGRNCSPHA
jgi:TRAP-type mannitol/chloroaromatic compound transport system permease large subunit